MYRLLSNMISGTTQNLLVHFSELGTKLKGLADCSAQETRYVADSHIVKYEIIFHKYCENYRKITKQSFLV